MKAAVTKINLDNISEQEWQARQELACCYRAFVHYGWTDLIYTHLSVRAPGENDRYLINPYGLLFQEITASNLIKVDFDGNVVAGDYPYNNAGHAIHTAILKARPEVNVVLHSHTRAGMAVSCMVEGLLPLTQQANEISGAVCYHKYGVVTDNEEECRLLGESIADKWVMIMHNHGLLSAGRTVGEAFYFLYQLENACKVQVDVMASGANRIVPDEEAIKALNDYGMPPADAPFSDARMAWDAVTRMMDRKDASWRS